MVSLLARACDATEVPIPRTIKEPSYGRQAHPPWRSNEGVVICLDRTRQNWKVLMTSPTPDHWQIQDAKQRFSEMIRAVTSEGPQVITRHGEDVAVIVLGGPKFDGTADVFAEIEAERKTDFGRAVDLEAGM